jgi:hypothetical protein
MAMALPEGGVAMTIIRPDRLANADQPGSTEIESEVREFVRRDFSVARRHGDPAMDPGVQNLHTLIHRVAGASTAEIERVIGELQAMRDQLREARDRAQREIDAYADFSHSVVSSVTAVADNLARWRAATVPDRNNQIQDEAG